MRSARLQNTTPPRLLHLDLVEPTRLVTERGLSDMIFSGDASGIINPWEGGIDAAVRWGVAWRRLDMSPWITAMSRVTSHLGFGLTYASTFMHPCYVARLLNSLDHITNGSHRLQRDLRLITVEPGYRERLSPARGLSQRLVARNASST